MPGDPEFLETRLELFFGEASDAVAYVYARVAGGQADAGAVLSGCLVGPSCRYADTLPSRFPLVDRGPGDSLLAQAAIPEPSFWTPEMPHLYQAEVQLSRAGKVVATARRSFGIRRLGVAGRKLIFDGKRWVLRGVARDEVATGDLDAWRDACAAMLVRNPTNELCDEASRVGVLLVTELDAADVDEIRRLARWPAVGIVVLPAGTTLDPRELGRPNLIMAQRFAVGQPVEPAPWAQMVLVEFDVPAELAKRVASCSIAIIPVRPVGASPGVAAARAACDDVQRDLAGMQDWAGYIV